MLRRLALILFAAALPACAEPAATPATATATEPAPKANPTTKTEPSPTSGGLPSEPVKAPPAGTQRVTYSQCNVPGPFIAITFDDGPHGAHTPRLLQMLKERGIPATFYLVGQNVAEYPEITKQIADEGHEVANHSWSHPLLTKMAEGSVFDQIDRTHNVIRQTSGQTPTLFRPPYGGFSTNQRAWAHAKWGYTNVLWDVDSNDWKTKSAAKITETILTNTRAGSIILCHDIHKTTIDAMPATLDGLRAKGFKFVTNSQLIAMHREKPAAAPAKPAKALSSKEGAAAATSLDDLKPKPAKP